MNAAESGRDVALRVLPLIDLTSLGDDDQPADIDRLCADAVTEFGSVASVCVWPRFVSQAARLLADSDVLICAVANFPAGDDNLELALADARSIVDAGGQEVDVVVPWRSLVGGRVDVVEQMVAAVRSEVGSATVLKAILETGEIGDESVIIQAGREALSGGADFLKTSTGKTEHSATPEAVVALASVLAEWGGATDGPGIKVSGGVSTVDQAGRYLAIVDEVFGPAWVGERTVRFGASRLLGDVLESISGGDRG